VPESLQRLRAGSAGSWSGWRVVGAIAGVALASAVAGVPVTSELTVEPEAGEARRGFLGHDARDLREGGASMAATGPLEILVMGFAGEGLPNGVGTALEHIQGSGDVRVVEAFLVMKTVTGALRIEEVTDVMGINGGTTDLNAVLPNASLWMDHESVQDVGGALEPGSTALALVLAHPSAPDVVTAFRDLGGIVLASTRLPTATDPSLADKHPDL
jgi:hypothetical protein